MWPHTVSAVLLPGIYRTNVRDMTFTMAQQFLWNQWDQHQSGINHTDVHIMKTILSFVTGEFEYLLTLFLEYCKQINFCGNTFLRLYDHRWFRKIHSSYIVSEYLGTNDTFLWLSWLVNIMKINRSLVYDILHSMSVNIMLWLIQLCIHLNNRR